MRVLVALKEGDTNVTPKEYFMRSKDDGHLGVYKKSGVFQAEQCTKEQQVVTLVDGEKETTNKALPGDWIVTGPKGERYVLKDDKFQQRYEKEGTGNLYVAKGICYAIQYFGPKITFTAPWGEDMILKNEDYVCSTVTNGDDIYRIEKEVFESTYKPYADVV